MRIADVINGKNGAIKPMVYCAGKLIENLKLF